MTIFEVNSEAITTASAGVRASIGTIATEVATMNGRLAELQASWRGSAASAFHASMDQWRGTQRQLEQALEAINQALASAGQTYAEVEQQNTALFAR
jgi:WXG100 family type VII secretion target